MHRKKYEYLIKMSDKGGFDITHFNGGGNSLGKVSGSIGGQYTAPRTNGGTQFSIGAQRHGQLLGPKGTHVDIGTVGVNHNINNRVNVHAGGHVGTHGNKGFNVGFGIKF